MKIPLLFLCLLFACRPGGHAQSANPATPLSAATNLQVFQVKGVVRRLDPSDHSITVKHEAIPNYMGAMTMPFTVRDTNELGRVSSGDTITFRLLVSEEDSWIDQIRKIGSANTPIEVPTPRVEQRELKPGDTLPDFEIIAEDGHRVHLADFRGKSLAFTFFFTRCPLPDYCPRMNGNFAKARQIVLAATNAPTNWQFLSISFDPDFDQPAVLASYANVYRNGNADRWLFAAASTNVLAKIAPRLDLMIMREGGSISHNLRTVVLDTGGRIYRQFDNNDWTSQQLADAVLEAARLPTQ